MEEKECSKSNHCRTCYASNCNQREEEKDEHLEGIECSGNCFYCDGAIGYHNDISKSIPNRFDGSIRVCGTYHLISHHGFQLPNYTRIIGKPTAIESLNNRLDKCNDSCKYHQICQLISSNCNFALEDAKKHFNFIEWRFENQKFLDSIPKDKIYAFCICEQLQEELKLFNLSLIESFKKLI